MNGLDIYYDRDGIPIASEQWCQYQSDTTYKRIARTTIMDAAEPETVWEVSTVWLGIDHGFMGGPPLIFETMVFAEGSASDEACERYSTVREAEQGHISMVAVVAAELGDPIVMDAAD